LDGQGPSEDFAFEGRLSYSAYVNRDLASESQLQTIDQLLDPTWSGKITVVDPRVTGTTSGRLAYLLMVKGEAWLRKLLGQNLVIVAEGRQLTEAIMRGRNAIGIGMDLGDMELLKQQGLIANVKPLAHDSVDGATLSTGYGGLALVNKAPHPNAAKVFINWLLSKEGQKAYVAATNLNSRRLDVEGPAETAPSPNIKYRDPNREENQAFKTQAISIAKEMIK